MLCYPLDIPEEVIAAQEAGKLVIFAGAGISCGGTSNLPLFDGLAARIGSSIGKTVPAGCKDYDILLGEWEQDYKARVHQITRDIIGDPTSRPNAAHRHLLQLFKKQEQVRVVTTNYDRHFTTLATELYPKLPVYHAPALPLGHDFHGIVYLHGSVEDEKPERLVLTDADFGRAYLSEGWARTFLQGLYAHFHVLFVGYSHADSLLSYLARGLSSGNQHSRYAIQPKGDETRWGRLGVTVIPYDKDPEPEAHAPLTVGLARWVELASFKPQDERDRIRQIVAEAEGPGLVIGGENILGSSTNADTASAIQLTADATDFLRRLIPDRVKAGWFTERAKDIRWISWLHDAGLLCNLTEEKTSVRRPVDTGHLLGWMVERLMENHTPQALALFVKLGGSLGPDAWWWFVRTLVAGSNKEAVWASPHLDHWLIAVRHGCGARLENSLLSSLIKELVQKGKVEHALGLFQKLLQLRVTWVQPWMPSDGDRTHTPEPKLVCEEHDLSEAWEAIQPIRNDEADDRLLRMVSLCIEELYAAHGTVSASYDPVAGSRAVVDEPRGQYDPHDAEGFVPDMLIRLLKTKAAAVGGIGEPQILRWLKSAQVAWHRYAYYALRVDACITATRKLELILGHELVYPEAWQLQNDPNTLVIALYGVWTPEEKRQLLDRLAAGPAIKENASHTPEELAANAIETRDNFLNQLAHNYPGDSEISATFSKLGLELPQTTEDHHADEPELGNGVDVERSPKTKEQLLAERPDSQIDYFLNYTEERRWSRPNRVGLIGAILAAANEDAQWAQALISSLIARGVTSGDLWDRLVWSLNWLTKDAPFRSWFLKTVLPHIDTTEWESGNWRGWTHALFRMDQKIIDEMPPEEWDILITWSHRAWQAHIGEVDQNETDIASSEALNLAINHPIGQTLEFWLTYLSHLRKLDPTLAYAWPDPLRQAIDQLLEINGRLRFLGLAVLGQRLRFVRYAFPEWTREILYSRMDISRFGNQAMCLWSAWLCYGQLSAELAADLPPFFKQNHRQLLSADDNEKTANHFISYVAVLGTSPFPPADTLRWIQATLEGAVISQRAWFIKEVARLVRGQTPERQTAVWSSWAREYFSAYQRGASGPTTAEEFLGFLHWPIAFSAVGDEVLTLLRGLTPHPTQRLSVIYEIKRSNLAKDKADFTARYLRWLFDTVSTGRWGYVGLDDVVDAIGITTQNRADLQVVADKSLLCGMDAEAEKLLGKLAAYDAAQRPESPPPDDSPLAT